MPGTVNASSPRSGAYTTPLAMSVLRTGDNWVSLVFPVAATRSAIRAAPPAGAQSAMARRSRCSAAVARCQREA